MGAEYGMDTRTIGCVEIDRVQMMKVEIREETVDALVAYSQIPIAFQVITRFRVEILENGLGGFGLTEEPVDVPYIKDYDEEHEEKPTRWAKRWDISNWGILSAFEGAIRIGGAVVAFDTPGVHFLEGRKDIAALWDIRLRPESRGCGVGAMLFKRAVGWSQRKGCHLFKVETQNINVPACRFYAKQGCELGAINRYAYPDLPDEVQLIWYRHIR